MNQDEINSRFTYHPPVDNQAEMYALLRGVAKNLAMYINEHCPESREKSLAVTHLEEAVFWSNASIARHGSVDPTVSDEPLPIAIYQAGQMPGAPTVLSTEKKGK